MFVAEDMYQLGSQRSAIRELFEYGKQRAAVVGAENVYDFSLGNPTVPAPDCVNETIRDLTQKLDSISLHGYTSAQGDIETRQAIADYLNKTYETAFSADNFYLTMGAAASLSVCFRALTTSPEDEFITIAPFFPEYRVFVEANGAKLVVVPPHTSDFQIDFEALEKAISAQTKGVIINSPNNPSGVVYTEETLKGLAALLERKSAEYGHPIYIIADEPYRELVYGGVKVPFIPCLYKNTIVCYSYSKSLSLPGERIGYVYVPGFADDRDAVFAAIAGAARIMGHVCPPTLIQKVIELCAEERPDLVAYDENRNLLYNSLREMGYECAKPDGAFYLFVKAPNGDANAFSEKAKLDHNLLVVPADGFGCPGFFRLSYCVSNDMIRRSLPAFKAMIESYK